MRQPEVESVFENGSLRVTKFLPSTIDDKTGKEFVNFETLAMLIWDANYNGKEFTMTDYRFAEDLVQVPLEHTDEEVQEQLKEQKQIIIPIKPHGETIFMIYVDIFGNEFKQEIKTT